MMMMKLMIEMETEKDPLYWSKFHHQLEDAREDLLKLGTEPKLDVLGKFIRNSDLDLCSLTVSELQKSTNRACSVVDDDDDEERIPLSKSVTVPKRKRSKTKQIINPRCKKSYFEAPKAEKPVASRFKLKPPEKSFVSSKPATSSLDRDYGDEIKKPITNEGKMVQKKSEKFGSKRPCSHRDDGDEEKARRAKKRMNNTVRVVPDQQQPPELPEKLKEVYKDRNVSEAVLIIQKQLYSTDVSSGNGRFSMPLNQLDNKEFLTKDEKDFLSSRNGKIPIKLIQVTNGDENCKIYNINLRQWDMKKPPGKINSIYNLITGWNEFVKDNKLRKGMIVQVWAFRVDLELWFSLVKL